ncbi:MAG TPA: guanylate kinase [Gemmatimonadaceae bacterium]
MNPFPLIISSPSGGGKTTIMRLLLERRSDVGYSVSATTRAPRNGEVHSQDYFFVTKPEFAAMRERGEFAESAEVHGNWYGTLRSQVDLVLSQEKHVIMDIDVQGARQFRTAYPESVMVFLLPPSAEALMQRLTSRRTETEEAFRTRLKAAREELRAAVSYQYAVVNDDLESAYGIVSSIIDAEAVRHARQPQLTARVTALVEELDRQLFQLTTPA